MPLRTVKLDLDIDFLLHAHHSRRSRNILPRMKEVLEELLLDIEKEQLLEPALVYDFYPIVSFNEKGVTLNSAHFISGSSLHKRYPQAKELAVAVCTIGPRLENRAAELFTGKEALRATLLDTAGSAAIDLLAQEACKSITCDSAARNYQAGGQIRPGMPGLPISEQSKIIEMVGAERIGVTVLHGELMVPQKSVSLLTGIGTHMDIRSRSEICNQCNLKETCPYRIFAEESNG